MILINNETDEMSCKSLDLSSFLFLLYNFFTGESKLKWILADSLRLSRFPPICFLIKHHCTNGLYYFTWTEMFNTVFVDTRLSKTKHPRKRFQNFRQSCMLSTDRIEIHQSQPLVWPSDLDNTHDWRKFWKRFRGCFLFESRVSTKTVVIHRKTNSWNVHVSGYILYMLLCRVCNQIKSERSGESPSLSTRKLCKTGTSIKCFFLKKKKTKNEALGKLKRKKYFLENVFPNIFFFCLGLAKRLYFN